MHTVLAGATGRLYHSPIGEVRLDRWAYDRCVLIGDAAHATAPVWAQGAALGMEDALTLAGVLADGDRAGAGARYESRPRVAHVRTATDRFSKPGCRSGCGTRSRTGRRTAPYESVAASRSRVSASDQYFS